MKWKCEDTINSIPDYIDGSLTSERKSVFEKHLANCQNCSDELKKQQVWLNSHFVNEPHMKLSEEEKNRLHDKIMLTIRSNEQSHRAAEYISAYKKQASYTDAQNKKNDSEHVAAGSSTIFSRKRKGKDFWRSLPVLTGYAAVIFLVFITAILIRNLGDSTRNDLDQGAFKSNVDNLANNRSDSEFSDEAGGLTFNGLGDDSATMPIQDSEVQGLENIENETAAYDMGAGAADGEDAINTIGQWRSYNGRLEDLSMISGLIAGSEDSSNSILASAKAVRIIIEEISSSNNTVSANNSNTEITEAGSDSTRLSDNTNVPVETEINSVLVLSAWNSWDYITAADEIKSRLSDDTATEYDIIILDDNMASAKIKAMIGDDEAAAWQDQIEEQQLEEMVWLALIARQTGGS